MMNKTILKLSTLAFVVVFSLSSCAQLDKILGTIKKPQAGSGLSNEEVINGLKEALTVGTGSAAAKAGQLNGFYKNPRLFIPWPEEALKMKERLVALGFQSQITAFEESLNRAAEEAASHAKPVFVSAITNMSVGDGFKILKGSDTAATAYLRKTTYDPLREKFLPVVREAIEKVDVTSYWNPLVTAYNRIPGVQKQNPDLDDYVTGKAINGLMLLIADEEIRIRKDPKARVTELLKKVFG